MTPRWPVAAAVIALLLGTLPQHAAAEGPPDGAPRAGERPGPGGRAGAGRRGGEGKEGKAGRARQGQAAGERRNKAAGSDGEGSKGGGRGLHPGIRGNMFLRQGSARAAALSFQRQLAENPDSAAVHVGLGKALAKMGRCEEALEHFWPYIGTVPFGGEAALASSTCSSRLGLLDDALYFDQLAVELDPTSARARTNLVLDLDSAGDFVGRDAALEELMFLRRDRDASLYARAVLALRSGDIDAFDRVAFAWEMQEGPSLDLRRLQAQSWLDMDDPVNAFAALANIRRIRNGQQVRHLRAESLRRMGFPDDAARYLEDRAQSVLEGSDGDAIRVRVLADQGDFKGAAEILTEYEGAWEADIVASAWYLAKREGRAADQAALESVYDGARQSPLRALDALVPWPQR